MPSGDSIKIEERAPHELTTVRGPVVSTTLDIHKNHVIDKNNVRTVSIAADGIDVWNAAFDVTPASLITGIVTERGVILKQDGQNEYDLSKI